MGKVTPQIFDTVKTLLNSGVPGVEICDMLKLSHSVVYRIKGSNDIQAYKRKTLEYSNARSSVKKKRKEAKKEELPPEPAPQVVEHRQTVTIQATHYMMEEMRKTNELLATISNKLAYIVDDLYGVKKTESSGG